MSVADRFGRASRLAGVLTSIRHVREEHVDRVNHHGGECAELNKRFLARTEEIESRVAKLEREVLG